MICLFALLQFRDASCAVFVLTDKEVQSQALIVDFLLIDSGCVQASVI